MKQQDVASHTNTNQQLCRQKSHNDSLCKPTTFPVYKQAMIKTPQQIIPVFYEQIQQSFSKQQNLPLEMYRVLIKYPDRSTNVLYQLNNKSIKPPQSQVSLTKMFTLSIFQNLMWLYIEGCYGYKINNCEFVSFMDAPQLRNLYMTNNFIVNFKSLQKVYLPQISCFKVCSNPSKVSWFERAKFRSYNQAVIFESQFDREVINQDVAFMAKVAIAHSESLSFTSQDRIKTPKVYLKLREKFNDSKGQNKVRISLHQRNSRF